MIRSNFGTTIDLIIVNYGLSLTKVNLLKTTILLDKRYILFEEGFMFYSINMKL